MWLMKENKCFIQFLLYLN